MCILSMLPRSPAGLFHRLCSVFEHLLAQNPGITLNSTGNMDMSTLNLSPLHVSLQLSLSPPPIQQHFIGHVSGTLLITRDVIVSKTGKVLELTEYECWPRKQGLRRSHPQVQFRTVLSAVSSSTGGMVPWLIFRSIRSGCPEEETFEMICQG